MSPVGTVDMSESKMDGAGVAFGVPAGTPKKGLDDAMLLGRLHDAIREYGDLPSDGNTLLTRNQMRVAKNLVQGELNAFAATMRALDTSAAATAIKNRKEQLIRFFTENNFSEVDAFCLVHGEYPRGMIGQAAMTMYKAVKVVDGILVCIADTGYGAVKILASKSLDVCYAIRLKTTEVVPVRAMIQYLAPKKAAPKPPGALLPPGALPLPALAPSSAPHIERRGSLPALSEHVGSTLPRPLAVSSPHSSSSATLSVASEASDESTSPHAESRGAQPAVSLSALQGVRLRATTPTGSQKGGVRPPLTTRSATTMNLGTRADGKSRATLDTTAVRVESCCTRWKQRVASSRAFHVLRWSWNHLLPSVIKDDIVQQCKDFYSEPVRDFVRWTVRTAAAVLVYSAAKRIGITSE